jgi:hypothetical protein
VVYFTIMLEGPVTHHNEASVVALPTSERPQTKIALVREQLLGNPSLHFAGEIHHFNPTAPESGYWTETVDIIVAPKKPQFDLAGLNDFMDGLITGVELSARDEAYAQSDDGIHLGKLYYDETIGSMKKTTITVIDTTEPDTIQHAGRVVGETQTERTDKIQRRTWVRVYPDAISADTVYDYENGMANGTVEPNADHQYAQHWLNGEQVRHLRAQYSHNPVAMAKSLLRRGRK